MKLVNVLYATAALGLLSACDGVGSGQSDAKSATANTAKVSESPIANLDVNLSHETFTLNNGLRVVVHTDRKAPIVTVSTWYHVGSKDEPEGKTGFAHLFEHLMFNGSENVDGDFFVPLEAVGAKSLNGTTWFDRTNYYETVPTSALEMTLFLESDRMGHLLGAVTQEKLDNQRGVVQNEKRQGDAQPYGTVEYRQLEGLYPPGHPYRHSTIGSMEDLDAASMEDVHGWFKQYYGAANTVVVLSGDVDVETAKSLMEKYYGDIPAGPPVPHMKSFVPVKDANVIDEMVDRVPNLRIYRNWAVPSRTTKEQQILRVAANVLAGGKNSRLYQALVYKNQLASSVEAYSQPFELTSLFEIQVNLKPGADEAKAMQILDETVAEFLAEGPTAAEVSRAQTQVLAGTVRGLETVNGKASILAQGALYAGDAGFYKKSLNWIGGTDASEVKSVSNEWLGKGYYQLTVRPYETYSVTESQVDRSKGLPEVGEMPGLEFPEMQEATLSNGMKVVLAARSNLPLVEMALQFDAGYAADAGGKFGAAKFSLSMMDEGTTSKSALEIADALENLGANITTASNFDVNMVGISMLKPALASSLDLYADIVRNPAFDQAELDRLRPRWLANIDQTMANPIQNVIRVMPTILYGEGHAYAMPYQGDGTKDSITSLTRDDLVAFHTNWIRPDNATMLIVGDLTMEEALPALEAAFGDWAAPATPVPAKNISAVEGNAAERIIIIDNPGLPSTMITAGQLLPPSGDDDALALNMATDILGGEFTARINMNLREEKGWTYYAYNSAFDARGQRMYLMYSPIQIDKTIEGFNELRREFTEFVTTNPATEAELEKTIAIGVNALPGQFETVNSVLGNMMNNNRFGRPYDDVNTLKQRYSATTLDKVRAVSKTLKPEGLVWVLVGDASAIEADVRGLGVGTVEVWDKDGNKLR